MAVVGIDSIAVQHEALLDELTLVNSEDTFFVSTMRKGKPVNRPAFSMPADIVDEPGLGAELEGVEVSRDHVTNHHGNRTQIWGSVQQFRETWGVTNWMDQDLADPAGLDDVEADARLRAMAKMKIKMEKTALSQQAGGEQRSFRDHKGTIRSGWTTTGCAVWVDKDAANTSSQYQMPANFRPGAAQNLEVETATSMGEPQLRELLLECRLRGKNKVDLLCLGTPQFISGVGRYFVETAKSESTEPVRHFNHSGISGAISYGLTSYTTEVGGRVRFKDTVYLNAVRNAGSLAGATTVNGDATVTVTSTAGLMSGMSVKGTGIPAGAYIASVTDATTFELSANATANGTPTLTLGAFDHALLLDMQFFYMRSQGSKEGMLPDQGGGNAGYMDAWASFICTNARGMGKIHTV